MKNKKTFLKGLLDKIIVESKYGVDRDNKKIQTGHSLTFDFRMKTVNDKLIYKDKSKKSLGYEIRQGKDSVKTDDLNFFTKRGVKKKSLNYLNLDKRSQNNGNIAKNCNFNSFDDLQNLNTSNIYCSVLLCNCGIIFDF